jgi:hypothetical protein
VDAGVRPIFGRRAQKGDPENDGRQCESFFRLTSSNLRYSFPAINRTHAAASSFDRSRNG